MRLWHRLLNPGCDESCRTICDHELAMSALRRMPRGGADLPPHPSSWPVGSPSGSLVSEPDVAPVASRSTGRSSFGGSRRPAQHVA